MEEIWKPIIGIEKYYGISSLGRIKSFERYRVGKISGKFSKVKEKILKLSRNRYGYLQAVGSINSKNIHLYSHRCVAIMFVDNPNNNKTVNHMDGNKQNNYFKNLEWCTQGENVRHAVALGLRKR